MEKINVNFMRIGKHSLPCPEYATEGAAAFDFRANTGKDDIVIAPGKRAAVPTGFAIEIPFGFVGILCARSGLAAKYGIGLANGIGVIDSDYRGEVKILLENHGDADFVVTHGERIGQMMIMPYIKAHISEVTELSETERGVGGFGSTGTK